jgi:lysophospholipase L1-like esterase
VRATILLAAGNESKPDAQASDVNAFLACASGFDGPRRQRAIFNREQYNSRIDRDARPSSRLRRILFPLGAVALALVAACAVFELGLRICGYGHNYTNPMGSFFEPDGELGCHGKANFAGRFHRTDFDVAVEHDAEGFRRNELPLDPAARHDVYVLGDSFVWGYGVGQHDLLTNQMQRQLDGRRVHNLGLIGAGTVQEYLLFQKHVVDRLRPGDTVVLVFFNNDFGDNVGLHSRGRLYAAIDADGQIRIVPPAPVSALRQWKNWLKDRSYLFNLVTYCADYYKERRSLKDLGDRVTRPMPSPEQIQADAGDSSPAVRITRHYLSELKDACAAKQVRFLTAYVPGQGELGEDDVTSMSDLSLPEEIAARQTFGRMVRDMGIEAVDIMPAMLEAKRSGRFERMTFTHDFHWTPAGHTIAAETIAAAIDQFGVR